MTTWRRLLLYGAVLVLAGAESARADPAWWAGRNVVNPQLEPDDYSILNLGQLKHMATEARNELNAFVPGGAGNEINTLMDAWSNGASADDFAICNLGQLKAVAKPFWDRLISTSGAVTYPWTNESADDNDYASANLGQLKQVFNFESDMDHDRLPDAWEFRLARSITALDGSASNDTDGDGMSDWQEFLENTDPLDPAPVITLFSPAGIIEVPPL